MSWALTHEELRPISDRVIHVLLCLGLGFKKADPEKERPNRAGWPGAQGMTGADKSVIVADLLAQIGHRLGFWVYPKRRLVTRRAAFRVKAASPITVNPNENFTLENSEREVEIGLAEGEKTCALSLRFHFALSPSCSATVWRSRYTCSEQILSPST